MMKLFRPCSATLVTLGLGLSVIPNAEARSVSAFLGQAQNSSNIGCFTNSNGKITNTSCGTTQFCVALPVDSALHTIEVTVRAPDVSHNIGCFAQAVDRNGVSAGGTGPDQFPSTFGSDQVLSLGTVSVPSAGGLYACCDMAQTSKWDSVNW